MRTNVQWRREGWIPDLRKHQAANSGMNLLSTFSTRAVEWVGKHDRVVEPPDSDSPMNGVLLKVELRWNATAIGAKRRRLAEAELELQQIAEPASQDIAEPVVPGLGAEEGEEIGKESGDVAEAEDLY
ncbi:hypothetical protein FN846DRAFT_903828 [Sphaerosporella brunnea]|uniref:Uncharacterized protein n=1 Tax=Sphaerosporella brunnea TaxID=1250544 RepID=A0A5J5F6F7_9PEZI|nr:hypothetical protein FN846DRAFT_903828 [Sphaerosporella brunnea]